MELPRYVALESKWNHKYLRYIREDKQIRGFLKFSGEEVVNSHSKFEVEPAKCDKRLVHIRCSYNNKYWVSWPSNNHWIVATADEPEEDRSKLSCTLFEPLYDSKHSAYRFLHVKRGFNVCLWRTAAPYTNCLYCGYSDPDKDLCDLYTIIDWESLMVLPKHVALKSDKNYYLMACWIEGHPYLQFSCEDIGDPRVSNETFTTSNGCVRIKSDYHGKFWRRSPNWIWADTDDTSSKNPDTLFWPVKVDDNIVALRNLGNNKFCKRLNCEGKRECLNADVPTITEHARLKIEEPLISRSIYNVDFRVLDARIYDQKVLTMATGNAINRTSQANTVDLKLSYTETETSIWESVVSLKLSAKTTIKTGVPFIVDGKIEISAELSGSYKWGGTRTSTKVVETLYKVTVPPMSMVKVSLLATKGCCDVPFSYTQRDILLNGKQVLHTFDDGVYTGINSYNFKYETKQIPL